MKTSGTATRWRSPLLATAVLIALVAVGSYLATDAINQYEKDLSFTRLAEEADSLADRVSLEFADDQTQLSLVASLIAKADDPTSPQLAETLSAHASDGTISRLELLLPDDTVITADGAVVDASGQLSFDEMAQEGAHVTGRETDVLDPDLQVVRNCVPVVRDGRTVAILCGVIELGSLPDSLAQQPYGGEAAIYLIEGRTGDFLVDTWHPGQAGNIWELGERPLAPGYSHDQLRADLTEGRSGYVVFQSQSIGEDLYFYFEPCGINDWQVALSVPESLVFERANAIRGVLNVFLAFEAVCFVAYFAWMLRYARREATVKQRQLDALNRVYEIEKLLFNAHENRESLTLALRKIAQTASAECIALWLVDGKEPVACFLYDDQGFRVFRAADGNAVPDADDALRSSFHSAVASALLASLGEAQDRLVARTEAEVSRLAPEATSLKAHNLIAVPIESDGSTHGILVACNVAAIDVSASLLKSVEPSFAMFCRNLSTHYAIKNQGEVDAMSGLFNRNRFEADRDGWPERCRDLACVYIDVNGLHELNNAEGHDAGDRMLRDVARHIRSLFGTEGSYRMGGDEFVVLVPDTPETTVLQRVSDLKARLAEQRVCVSTGIARQKGDVRMDELLAEAEKRMYQEKRAFYERGENDWRRPRRP